MGKLIKEDVLVLMWLVALACSKQTATYSEMASQFGGVARSKGKQLSRIGNFCHVHNLPLLSVLVVNAKEGIPSDPEFYISLGVNDLKAEITRCFDFDWSRPE